MKRLVFVIAIACCACSAQSSDDVHITPKHAVKPESRDITLASPTICEFRLEEARDDVIHDCGSPRGYFDARAQRETGSYPSMARGLVWEVYPRKTAANEYEIKVLYRVDDSESRLHPKWRIEEIRFELDKRATAEAASGDIGEVRDLCMTGCKWGVEAMGNEVLVGRESHAFFLGAASAIEQVGIAKNSYSMRTRLTGAEWRPAAASSSAK